MVSQFFAQVTTFGWHCNRPPMQGWYSFVLHKNNCVDDPIRVTIGDLDVQCHKGRAGTLCGSCRENFSLALGSLNCLPCSNALIAHSVCPARNSHWWNCDYSILLHLTVYVAAGTINELIFYPNIIQANHQAFFSRGQSTINFLLCL